MATLKTLVAAACLLVALFAGEARGKREWAVLVCGSRGYFNYRHHADVCHAYQTLRRRGIPDERIITMMYDDVANDRRNPFPGQLFNRPTNGSNAIDVYKGCLKDYTGPAVTPENFLNVIRGEHEKMLGIGSGKVLNSTAEDDVFINFVDHGAPGLIAFPTGELRAKPLLEALEVMYEKKMYDNLVFYMEACESGSMFQKLPTGRNVYAVTAANARESSWATYCPPLQDKVNGVNLNTCLGDDFSIRWLEDTDSENADGRETLLQQYQRVRAKTKKSHVLDFGDIKRIAADDISNFLGDPAPEEDNPFAKALREEALNDDENALVDSRDVPFVSKFYRYMRHKTPEAEMELHEEMAHRKHVDALFAKITNALLTDDDDITEALSAVPPTNPSEWSCHEETHRFFKSMCTDGKGFSDYSLKYSATLLTLCEKLSAKAKTRAGHISQILSTMAEVCNDRVSVE
mmetsp:Transcript_12441/g.18675  ORF Transcript_12441/g.18675 Transcript_12441/m.18675 type:complete len:461 (-) Transcript_12441:31-1413(-)